ncbi:MAG: DUF3089 domain-containing protein [Endomicrobiia bacterium]
MFKFKNYVMLLTLIFIGQFIYAADTIVTENKEDNTSIPVTVSSFTTSDMPTKTIVSNADAITSSDTTKTIIAPSSDTTKSVVINVSSNSTVAVSSPTVVTYVSTDTIKNTAPITSNTINVSSSSIVKISTQSITSSLNVSTVTISTQPIAFSIENITVTPQPDYSKQERWALLPDKQDAKVDVFYIYPTIFIGNGPEYMDVTNTELKERAKNQATFDTGIFKGQANIYAPLYRQASIALLQSSKDATITSFEDVKRAFDYYMKHYNKGKPFFLAGFSQGSMAILDLLKNKFHDKDLRNKLIAAYIIGYSITDEDLSKYPYLKMAESADDIGVIISYNTQIANNGYSSVLKKNSKAINPISWKTNNKPSKEKQYRGAVIFDLSSNKIVSLSRPLKVAYLEIETNALVVDVNPTNYTASQTIFPAGVLHMYDYMFFYNNLQENVSERINNYFKKHK